MTDTSTTPQFWRPVTRISNNAASMYANPAYSVHMTRARLEVCRRLSLIAVALLILAVRVESVLSNEAASSPAWCCQQRITESRRIKLTLQGHRDTILRQQKLQRVQPGGMRSYGCCQQDMRTRAERELQL